MQCCDPYLQSQLHTKYESAADQTAVLNLVDYCTKYKQN